MSDVAACVGERACVGGVWCVWTLGGRQRVWVCVCVCDVRAPVCVWVCAAQTTWAASGRLAGMVVLGSGSNREHGDRN